MSFHSRTAMARLNQQALYETFQWSIRDKRNELNHILKNHNIQWRLDNPMEWLKLLRYYWTEIHKLRRNENVIKILLHSQLDIGYSEVGNYPELIDIKRKQLEVKHELDYEQKKRSYNSNRKRSKKV